MTLLGGFKIGSSGQNELLLPKMFQVAQALPGQNQQAPRLSLTGRVNGSQFFRMYAFLLYRKLGD